MFFFLKMESILGPLKINPIFIESKNRDSLFNQKLMSFNKLLILLLFLIPFATFSQDKNLEYFINKASENSPLLYNLRNQILSNSIDSQILVASRRLQVSGNGNSFYSPTIGGFGYDESLTNGGQLQALITASKTIVPKKWAGYQFKDLQLTGDSLKVAATISKRDLNKSIITQYITAYGDQLQLEFNHEISQLLNREEIILKKLTQQNVYKQVDYLSFLVTFQQQQLTQKQLELQFKNDYASLNYLAGEFDTTTTLLPQPSLENVKALSRDSSAYFYKFKIDSLKLINNKFLIDLGYRPHINLFVDGGFQSSVSQFSLLHVGRSIGVNFVIPLYDGNQRRLQYNKIKVLEDSRVRNQQFFINQYNQQIAQLSQQLTAIESLIIPINNQINYIKTLLEAYGKLLQTGDIKMTDYILALNNYITARNLVVQNQVSRYQIINQLNYWNK